MSYRIFLSPKANNLLEKLDKKRIKNKLKNLANNPKLGKPLTRGLSGL